MSIKILTVDDEADVRRLVAIKLRKQGFEVFEAADGDEGVAKAKEIQPALVIMDVRMPKMDGVLASRAIKEEVVPTPIVVMLAAENTYQDIVRGLTEGKADDYITKPFAPRDLVSRVQVALIKAGYSLESFEE